MLANVAPRMRDITLLSYSRKASSSLIRWRGIMLASYNGLRRILGK
jgi:hypothetical protein